MQAYVGGSTAGYDDLASRISAKLPLQIAVVITLSFVLLIVAFRTVVVPPQAAVMNLLSIGASYGVLTAVFQYGWLSGLIGLNGSVPIVSYVPLFMFAILFGLSMDYEVFLVSQIEEHVQAGEDNTSSVVSTTGFSPTLQAPVPYAFVGGHANLLLLDRLGNLWIGDDTSDGAINNAGRLWYISAGALATLPNLP